MLPRVLTIAGSDSGGGAGIQADIKTIFALGGHAMSAVTALTAQNTVGVRGVSEIPPDFVSAQIDAVVEDIGVDAAKTGMLASRRIVEAVADAVERNHIAPLVVDPVMVAKSGDALLAEDAREVLRARLLPLATVVTPNLPEAADITGRETVSQSDMRDAARAVHDCGPEWVLIKGGHLEGAPVDVLYDGADFVEVSRPRVGTKNTHGTGCTYSAAIATFLAHGLGVPEAVDRARDALQAALLEALPIGRGKGPLGHAAMWPFGRRE
jgi:hydroxymethylpyrimidine kinase/phosphomethylpyrimidine kinase